MKKAIKNIKKGTLLVVMFASMLSNANEISSLTINKNLKKTELTISDVREGNLLSIKDNNGIILYKEIIEKSGIYTKGFDLTALPNGDYFFEVDKDMEIKTIPFTVNNNSVVFKKEKETIFFKPYTRIINNRIYFTKLALKHESLKVELYYLAPDGSHLIHSEKIENTQVIERIYKLEKSETGRYKMVFKTKDRVFTKYISI